jgi:CheY-like chemotaxis protein
VLVVEDRADAAESLALLLRLRGHEARVARDGPSALKEAASFRPDAVLLDIGLPGMDGYEVARRLRRQEGGGRALLVALTGYGAEDDRRRCLEAGCDRHLVKPAEPAEVIGLLEARAGAGAPGVG